MRCPNCNVELKAQAKFCPKCGTKIPEGQGAVSDAEGVVSEVKPEPSADTQAALPASAKTDSCSDTGEESGDVQDNRFSDPGPEDGESEAGPPKKAGGRRLLAGGLALLAAAGLGIGGSMYYKHAQEVKRKQELKEELSVLINGRDNLAEWANHEKEEFVRFLLTDEEKERLKEYWQDGSGLDPEDYENQILWVRTVMDYKTQVKGRADADAMSLLESLKSQDPGYASDEQKEKLADYAKEMEERISEGGYGELEPLAEEWKSYALAAAEKKTGYQVSVMQYDFTEYPTVRIYLDVRDEASGGLVKELSPNMFYISERDAGNGDYLNRAVQKAVLMNENERLNINLLADTSGSMNGGNMDAAKRVMSNFISTVQFSAGDQVKLTPFNSVIDKSGYFTGDPGVLNNMIRSYVPDGQTKLYDSIIYGVQDVSGQEGAKCVIAFTDGMDVGSYNSAQDVVDLVSRYHIPVFIVRIGDSSTSAEDSSLQRIAQASGGSFRNLSQFSSDMSSFYDQIYRQLKEYYVVEYEADGTMGITQDKEISIYIQNQDQGGETVMAANAGRELFDSLLGSYLRSYITDMNNHRYEQLARYVDHTVAADDTWSIQWQMKKQVTGGFSNVTQETLMEYHVTDVTVVDENTIHLRASESYDVLYDEVYGDLKGSSRTVAQDALEYLRIHQGYTELSDEAELRIWAVVTQIPEYVLKKGADGKWKFSKYAGDLALGERRKVYDVEVTWDPYY